MVRPIVVCALAALLLPGAAHAQSAPPQPSLPTPPETAPPETSRTVDTLVHPEPRSLLVRRAPRHHARLAPSHRRHVARPRWPLERPALAGVALVAPLPPLREPPHIRVPMPAFPPETLAYWLNAPRPELVCAPTPRDPAAPDPHLYRERPVVCEADNP